MKVNLTKLVKRIDEQLADHDGQRWRADQPPQLTEPDIALVYLGSLFKTLDNTLPPERDEAKLDALAWHILEKRPKTLLGLAIRARAEKHLCRYLWTVDFERLPPSDQAARAVTECAILLSSRPCSRAEEQGVS